MFVVLFGLFVFAVLSLYTSTYRSFEPDAVVDELFDRNDGN